MSFTFNLNIKFCVDIIYTILIMNDVKVDIITSLANMMGCLFKLFVIKFNLAATTNWHF